MSKHKVYIIKRTRCFMNNYLKMTLFALSFLFLISIGFASAYHPYNTYSYTDRDSFSYNEDINGNDDGFRISFTDADNYRSYGYGNRGYAKCGDYYSWRSYGCDKYGYYGDGLYYNDNSYNNLDHNAVLKEAFKTYQQKSKQQYQLEAKRIALEERRRYGYYGGYGYGYSGVRYYSYGW